MVNQQSINAGLRELALFAGAGGGILGGVLLGWRTVCAVEYEPYPACVLAQRQNDGLLPPFPIWDDVCTFDGTPWRGRVDVVSGGFPCQDISCAGKGAGIDGERSGLWKEMARIIREVRPGYAFIENSPMLVVRGLDTVLCDLAEMGYDARWGIIGTEDAGGFCQGYRCWIVGKANGIRSDRNIKIYKRANATFELWRTAVKVYGPVSKRFRYHPSAGVCGMDNGLAENVDRYKAIGNGQSPQVAKLAWELLSSSIDG